MSASKSFIKGAVELLIVVAICFVTVMIYKKGNASINSSMSDYDEILSQFDNINLKSFENSTASGSQIVDLIKSLQADDGVTIRVTNGYSASKKLSPQEYTYASVNASDSTVLADISNRSKGPRYINPTASFASSVIYDENEIITSVVFTQK